MGRVLSLVRAAIAFSLATIAAAIVAVSLAKLLAVVLGDLDLGAFSADRAGVQSVLHAFGELLLFASFGFVPCAFFGLFILIVAEREFGGRGSIRQYAEASAIGVGVFATTISIVTFSFNVFIYLSVSVPAGWVAGCVYGAVRGRPWRLTDGTDERSVLLRLTKWLSSAGRRSDN